MGTVFYNLYRCRDKLKVDEEKLKSLDFMKSGERGKRIGVYLESIYSDEYGTYFKVCWDDRVEIRVDDGNKITSKEVSTIVMKDVIIVDHYVVIQRGDEDRIERFVRENFIGSYIPYLVNVDEEMIEYIKKRAKKIKGLTVHNPSKSRADKIKLTSITGDLRKTKDFEISDEGLTKSIKIIFGDKDRHWANIRVGNGGNVGISSTLNPKEKILIMSGVIGEYIEPKLRNVSFQQTLSV